MHQKAARMGLPQEGDKPEAKGGPSASHALTSKLQPHRVQRGAISSPGQGTSSRIHPGCPRAGKIVVRHHGQISITGDLQMPCVHLCIPEELLGQDSPGFPISSWGTRDEPGCTPDPRQALQAQPGLELGEGWSRLGEARKKKT